MPEYCLTDEQRRAIDEFHTRQRTALRTLLFSDIESSSALRRELGDLAAADDAESSATAGDNWPGWVAFDVTRSVRGFLEDPTRNRGWKVLQDSRRGIDDRAID